MYLLGETRSQEENASKESKETYRTHSPTFIDDRTANVYLFRPRVRHVSGISGTNMNLYSTDFVRCYVTTGLRCRRRELPAFIGLNVNESCRK